MQSNLTDNDPLVQVAPALEKARAKILAGAHADAGQLRSNMGMILRDFLDQHGISNAEWPPSTDPTAALNLLCVHLAVRLAEMRFQRFLEKFTTGLIELDEAERRSQ